MFGNEILRVERACDVDEHDQAIVFATDGCDEFGIFLMVNFGLRPVGMFNRSPNFVSVCSKCRRLFRDEAIKDVQSWLALNLDEAVRPDAEMVWGRRVKWGR